MYESCDGEVGTMKDKRYQPSVTRNTIEQQTPVLDPDDVIMFWGHHPHRSGKITKSCLSQWWSCSFADRELQQSYTSAEQYMMVRKALLFEDEECMKAILHAESPQEVKALGRAVKNFDAGMWNEYKAEIVFRGNLLKFSQNPELREFLLSTGEKMIIEASPVDVIWGIGLTADNPDAPIPQNWQGENLLGFILMDVRAVLRNGK